MLYCQAKMKTTQWISVEFADGSYSHCALTKNHLRVWRKVGTRYETANAAPTFKSGNASLCISRMFFRHVRSPLVRIT